MFICNHCPYVKAVTKELVEDCKKLKDLLELTQLLSVQMMLKIIQKTHLKT